MYLSTQILVSPEFHLFNVCLFTVISYLTVVRVVAEQVCCLLGQPVDHIITTYARVTMIILMCGYAAI